MTVSLMAELNSSADKLSKMAKPFHDWATSIKSEIDGINALLPKIGFPESDILEVTTENRAPSSTNSCHYHLRVTAISPGREPLFVAGHDYTVGKQGRPDGARMLDVGTKNIHLGIRRALGSEAMQELAKLHTSIRDRVEMAQINDDLGLDNVS